MSDDRWANTCRASYDFDGAGPMIWCDLTVDHAGDWHVETWVARWRQDGTGLEWWEWENGDYLTGKGHFIEEVDGDAA